MHLGKQKNVIMKCDIKSAVLFACPQRYYQQMQFILLVYTKVKALKCKGVPLTSSLLFPELCLKESLCVGISSKLLLDASGTQGSELDSIYSLSDRGGSINAVIKQEVLLWLCVLRSNLSDH